MLLWRAAAAPPDTLATIDQNAGVAGHSSPPALACWHAAQTRCGVAGISSLAPASPGMALAIAFITVAIAAVVAASPAPFTPSGLVVAGTGCRASRSGGMSSARGIA